MIGNTNLTPTKINSKYKTKKQENRRKLHDLVLGKQFLNVTPKARSIKERTDMLNLKYKTYSV